MTPERLAALVEAAWKQTIGGPIADEVRLDVWRAAEKALVELSTIPKDELSALVRRQKEALLGLIFSKIREEVRALSSPAWDEALKASEARISKATTRQLLSAVYYSFPSDTRVRRGDLVEIEGDEDRLWMIATPPCDLERFKEKTARRLMLLQVLPMNSHNIGKLRELGCRFDHIGSSIVGKQGRSGDLFIPLPNVPAMAGSRSDLRDYLLLCYGWHSRVVSVKPGLGHLEYDAEEFPWISRRCCLAEGVVEAVIAKVASVIMSPGLADLPKGEVERVSAAFKPA